MEQERHLRPEAGTGTRLAAPALRARRRYYHNQASLDFAEGHSARDWVDPPAPPGRDQDGAGPWPQSMRGPARQDRDRQNWSPQDRSLQDWARLRWVRLNEARLSLARLHWARIYGARANWDDYVPVLRNGAIIGAMGAVGFSVALYTSQPGLMKKVDKLVQAELALLPDPTPKPRPEIEVIRAAAVQPASLSADAAVQQAVAPAPAAANASAALVLAAATPAAADPGQFAPASAAPASAAPASEAPASAVPTFAAPDFAAPVSAPRAAGPIAPAPAPDAPAAVVTPRVAAPAAGTLDAASPAIAAEPAEYTSQAQSAQAQTIPAEAPRTKLPQSPPTAPQSPRISQVAEQDITAHPVGSVLPPAPAPARAKTPAPATAAPASAPPARLAEGGLVRIAPAMAASPLYAAPARLHRAAMLVARPRIPTIEPAATEMRATPHPAPRPASAPARGLRAVTPVTQHLKPTPQHPLDASKYALPDWLTHARPVRQSAMVMSEKPHYLVALPDPHQPNLYRREPQIAEHFSARPPLPAAVAPREDSPASPQPEADALTEAALNRHLREEARRLPALRQPAAPRYAYARWYYGQPTYAPRQNGYYSGQYMPPPPAPPGYGYGYGYGYSQ